MMGENWRPITGFEGRYEISDRGNVYSLLTKKNKALINKDGNLHVSLHDGLMPHTFAVHKLMAKEFLPNPDNKPLAYHKNGNPLDNHLHNLAWGERKDIVKKHIEPTGIAQVHNGRLIKTYVSVRDAAQRSGVNQTSILRTVNGIRHTAGGFKWLPIGVIQAAKWVTDSGYTAVCTQCGSELTTYNGNFLSRTAITQTGQVYGSLPQRLDVCMECLETNVIYRRLVGKFFNKTINIEEMTQLNTLIEGYNKVGFTDYTSWTIGGKKYDNM